LRFSALFEWDSSLAKIRLACLGGRRVRNDSLFVMPHTLQQTKKI